MLKKILILGVFIIAVLSLLISQPAIARDNLSGLIFCIDPGHGGTDPGATGQNGLKEADVVLELAKLVKNKLVSRGATVELTRADNSTVALTSRTNFANALKADRLISIHLNAFNKSSNYTLMTVYLTALPTSASTQIAAFIATDIHNEIGLGYASSNFEPAIAGVRKENFHMLRESSMPAVLTESSFIDNAAEEVKLRDPAYREKVAQIIYAGVCKHYGVPLTETPQKGNLNITLYNKADNSPVSNATVKITQKDGAIVSAVSAANGLAAFSNLLAGALTINVSHNAYLPFQQTFELSANQTSNLPILLEQPKTNSLIGLITDAVTGNRLANAKCSLFADGVKIGETYSSSTGVYKFSNLADNTYSVTAELQGYRTTSQSATATGGIEKWNSIKLEPAPREQAVISGQVTNAITAAGIENVKVTLYIGSTIKEYKYTDANGAYSFNNLAAGVYKLNFKPAKPYSSKTVSNINLAENQQLVKNVALTSPDMPGTLTGFVYKYISSKKVAVINENVEIRKDGNLIATLQTGWGASAGMFSISNLTPGSYTVTILGTTKTVKISPAGTANLNIRLY